MLLVRCNNCDSQLHYRPELAGEQVECAQCGARLRVPFDAPDLDAIKRRAQTKPPPEEPELPETGTDDSELPQPDLVIQASTHDLYVQRERQHEALVSAVENAHSDLVRLSTRLGVITRLLLLIILLLAVLGLGLIVVAIVLAVT